MLKIKKNSKLLEEDKITDVFLKYKSLIKRYLMIFLKQSQDVEDILQETYLRSYAAEFKSQINYPKAFLFKTARNLALKHLDKSSTRLVDYIDDLTELETLVNETSAEIKAQEEEHFLYICKAVSNLPRQCRKVFILRKIYGYSHKEIAKIMNLSHSTIEKHLATGIMKCSDYMRSKTDYFSENKEQSNNIAR